MSYVRLSEDQMQHLFDLSLGTAQKDVRQIFSKGKWQRGKDNNGNAIMVWRDGVRDNDTWREMPKLVKAVCDDLSYNLGGAKMAKYQNFIKAVKAKDYRRAALELLDSRDFKNSKEKNHLDGVAKRRLDAAIELSDLAEEQLTR